MIARLHDRTREPTQICTSQGNTRFDTSILRCGTPAGGGAGARSPFAGREARGVERETGFEPATFSLGS